MSLSEKAQKAVKVAIAEKPEGQEVLDRIDRSVANVADLGQDISGTYVEAEVQAISDKVDELLAAMRASGLME